MLFRLPVDILNFKHHALLTENVGLTKIGEISYNETSHPCEFSKTVVAGIYGFHNKEVRDRFVSVCNAQEAGELAFPISIEQ